MPSPSTGSEPPYVSKGQLAMRAVLDSPLAPNVRARSGVDRGREQVAAQVGVSAARISQALLVREYAPQLVQEVVEGRVVLDHAYATAQHVKEARQKAGDPAQGSGQAGPSDPFSSLDQVRPPYPLRVDHPAAPSSPPPTKRNSGRTGPRRLTQEEVAQRGQHAVADHRRRYGQSLPTNQTSLPPPPAWFTAELRSIWAHTLTSAPPGLLHGGDHANLVTFCTAVELQQRLARQLAEQPGVPEPELVQQLRLVGSEVGRASKVLGLTPPERARIGIPVQPEQAPVDAWGPLVIAGGKAAA
jgi:hypothetical protein